MDGEGTDNPMTKIPSFSCLVSSLTPVVHFVFVLAIHNPKVLVSFFFFFFPRLSGRLSGLGVFELFCMGHHECLACSLKISEVFYQVKHILLTVSIS